MTRTRVAGLLGSTAVLAFFVISADRAQGSQAEPQTAGTRKAMMSERSDEMAAADKRLDDLLRAMESTTGPAKVDSLAAVVVELVAQHRAMHGRMGRMGGMSGQPAPPAAASGAEQQPAPGNQRHQH
jgi:hypothetical protein